MIVNGRIGIPKDPEYYPNINKFRLSSEYCNVKFRYEFSRIDPC